MAEICEIKLATPQIPFRMSFSHASSDRQVTATVVLCLVLSDGSRGFGECAPRSYVTGEDVDSVLKILRDLTPALLGKPLNDFVDVDHIYQQLDLQQLARSNPAALCALDLALHDAAGRASGRSIFDIWPSTIDCLRYSAVISAGSEKTVSELIKRSLDFGLTDFKIKISGDVAATSKILSLCRNLLDSQRTTLRCDANNAFAQEDSVISDLAALLLQNNVVAIEEPFAAGATESLLKLREKSTGKFRIVLDESAYHVDHLKFLNPRPEGFIVNVRVSKMGGLRGSIAVMDYCKSHGILCQLGAQVGETSLLTQAGIIVAGHFGQMVFCEGAVGTLLLEKDIVTPSVMFGAGGMLEIASMPKKPGLGVQVDETQLKWIES